MLLNVDIWGGDPWLSSIGHNNTMLSNEVTEMLMSGLLQDQSNRLRLLETTMIMIRLILNVINYNCDYIVK